MCPSPGLVPVTSSIWLLGVPDEELTMSYVRSFLMFWYNFIIGDDWTVAAAVAVALAITYWLGHQGVRVWWLLPAVVILTKGVSAWRAKVHR